MDEDRKAVQDLEAIVLAKISEVFRVPQEDFTNDLVETLGGALVEAFRRGDPNNRPTKPVDGRRLRKTVFRRSDR